TECGPRRIVRYLSFWRGPAGSPGVWRPARLQPRKRPTRPRVVRRARRKARRSTEQVRQPARWFEPAIAPLQTRRAGQGAFAHRMPGVARVAQDAPVLLLERLGADARRVLAARLG